MADMTQQGPHITGQMEPQHDRLDRGADQALSGLSVAPHFSDIDAARPPVHTSTSVQERWNTRRYDTGVTIEGRLIGREK